MASNAILDMIANPGRQGFQALANTGQRNKLLDLQRQQQAESTQTSDINQMQKGAPIVHGIVSQALQIPDDAQRAQYLTKNQQALESTGMFKLEPGDERIEALTQMQGQLAPLMKSQKGEALPSSVQEWQFFNKLPKQDQTKFLNMKRQGYTVKDIGGVPTVIPLIPGEKAIPLSTLDQESAGQASLAEAKEEAVGTIKGRQQQLNALRTSRSGRLQSIKKASKFLDLFKNRNMKSGAGRTASKYVPGAYTDQGKLDEEFNAFSEVAARQALKASGELRPTDADVEGMKRAMFGIGRDESVNIILLEDYLEQQEMDEQAYKDLKAGKKPIERRSKQAGTAGQTEAGKLSDDDLMKALMQ